MQYSIMSGGCSPCAGGLERAVICKSGAPVYVDYAHTPDALKSAIEALRPHVKGRLVTVFGAGGDRDTGKRPEMGRIASDMSDIVIVTDDNPRSEDPAAIRAAIMASVAAGRRSAGTPGRHCPRHRDGGRGRYHPACGQGS